MLEQSCELLGRAGKAGLVRALDVIMATAPMEKPEDHKGGLATDMFELNLSGGEVGAVLEVVRHASMCGESTEETRERGLAGFVEAWAECLTSVAGTGGLEQQNRNN